MRDDAKWKMGCATEAAIRLWLQNQGHYVVRTSDIKGTGAPMLEGADGAMVILPDVLDSFRGHTRWVEIKAKSRSTWHNQLRRNEHGLPLKNWMAYMEVQAQSGIPGSLCIYELQSGIVLLQSLDVLSRYRRDYNGSNMPGGEPHVFFPRDRFEWHQGPNWTTGAFARIVKPECLTPLSIRTIKQKPEQAIRQLEMFDK